MFADENEFYLQISGGGSDDCARSGSGLPERLRGILAASGVRLRAAAVGEVGSRLFYVFGMCACCGLMCQ